MTSKEFDKLRTEKLAKLPETCKNGHYLGENNVKFRQRVYRGAEYLETICHQCKLARAKRRYWLCVMCHKAEHGRSAIAKQGRKLDYAG